MPDASSLDALDGRLRLATRAHFERPVALWLRLHEHDARGAARFVASHRSRLLDSNFVLMLGRRVDLALATRAEGVHLSRSNIGVEAARSLMPGGSLVGVSCHDEMELRAAMGADYVTLSPVHGVPDKGEPLGIEGFASLCTEAKNKVVALGGITLEGTAALIRAGAHGVAIRRALDSAPDPEAMIRRFEAAIDEAALAPPSRGGAG